MISIKTKSQINIMKENGKILASVFEAITENIREGVTASYLDKLAETVIRKAGGEPSFLGYKGFKYTTCMSKNEEIVHGLATEDKILFPGDIISIDCGVYKNGFHVDAARTFKIGKVSDEVEHLVKVTQESFFASIKDLKAGDKMGRLSHRMQAFVEAEGLTVVRDLCSHGVGKELHEDPLIPNYGPENHGVTLKHGMTLAIEPMVVLGGHEILTLDDKWTIITRDRKWAAHYENTILITEQGVEVLTI